MREKTLEKRTRDVFHKIHLGHAKDNRIFSRLTSLLNEKYLRVKKGFFNGKICLDAGCGSAAPGAFSILQMGASHVYCIDLDSSIFNSARAKLKPFAGNFTLETGNVLNLKYPDEYFDFVCCAGVLHHTQNTKAIFRGLNELARVTKKGGILYLAVKGKGGIIEDVTNCLRERYLKDKTFKRLIDNLSPIFFHQLISFVLKSMRKQNDLLCKNIDIKFVKKLFDLDLILTIRDRIQAPTYLEINERELNEWILSHGFSQVKRLTRYPKYANIRRLLSPLYYNYQNSYSRLLYGDGVIQLKAVKRVLSTF